ncbi:hypothetical protein D3248_14800 [Leucobacter zeae]|nr:hypothetical protein [Leucobacter zeae]
MSGESGTVPAAVGLVVNPFAGIGGEVGLGGSDGADVRVEAARRGGRPRAPERAVRFVRELRRLVPGVRILTGAGPLGEDAAALDPGSASDPGRVAVVGRAPTAATTTGADTTALAAALAERGAAVIVFVGGDGTARDVLAGVTPDRLCLGVPAGVKMHSGVFAVTPEDAAQQAADVLAGRGRTALRDVVDLDEAARRAGVLSTSVYGTMRVPDHERLQRGKRSPAHGSGIDADGVAAEVRSRFPGLPIAFGPGTTVARIAERFGIGGAGGTGGALLGFDVLDADGGVHHDASGAVLEQLLLGREFAVVLSPVGGQGFVIGRGNHQLTERLLAELDPDNLVIVAEPAKLGELGGRLRIDAPTAALNDRFRGPRRVLLGRGDIAVAAVE